MAVEIAATLATTVVSQLLIPFVKKGAETLQKELFDEAGKKMAQDAADKLAKGAVSLAEKAWQRVRSAFGSDQEKAALTVFESDPETAAPILTKTLTTKLQADPALMNDLRALVDQKVAGSQSTGATIFGDYGIVQDFRGATFSGGDVTITGASYGSQPTSYPSQPKQDPPKTGG